MLDGFYFPIQFEYSSVGLQRENSAREIISLCDALYCTVHSTLIDISQDATPIYSYSMDCTIIGHKFRESRAEGPAGKGRDAQVSDAEVHTSCTRQCTVQYFMIHTLYTVHYSTCAAVATLLQTNASPFLIVRTHVPIVKAIFTCK